MHRLLRPSISPRRLLVVALALVVGAGIGLGAAMIWAPSDAAAPETRAQAVQVDDPRATEPTPPEEGAAPESEPADVPESVPPAPAEAPADPQLSLDEVKAIALKAAGAGRVVEIDDDNEPTGLRYDVKVLHDNRTSTDVEVDATTGEITSIDHDDDWD